MKHFFWKEHTTRCENTRKRMMDNNDNPYRGWGNFCQLNPSYFLFYMHGNFVLLTYFSCQEDCGHLDFKSDILSTVSSEHELTYKTINRSIVLNESFRNNRIRMTKLETITEEINYVYTNCFGKQFCFTRAVDFLDLDRDKIEKNYLKATEYLIDNKIEYLQDQLNILYNVNVEPIDYGPSELDKIKSIDVMVKHINKLIKQ